MRTRLFTTMIALVAAGGLLAACGSEPAKTETKPTDVPSASESTSDPAPAKAECVTQMDLNNATAIALHDEDKVVPNEDGYALVIKTGAAPSIAKAGDLQVQTSTEPLPEAEDDANFYPHPVAGGWIVGIEAKNSDALSTSEWVTTLVRINNDGSLGWTKELAANAEWTVMTGDVVATGAVTPDDEPTGPESYDIAFLDAAEGKPLNDPRPGRSFTPVEGSLFSSDPTAFAHGSGNDRERIDIDGKPVTGFDDLHTVYGDGWQIQVTDKTADEPIYGLTGSKIDGSAKWSRDVRGDYSGAIRVGLCGQYAYVPAPDGIHVLDQAQGGKEISVIAGPEDTSLEPLQAPGFLAWSFSGDKIVSTG